MTLFRWTIAKEVFTKLSYTANTADYVNRLSIIRKSVCFICVSVDVLPLDFHKAKLLYHTFHIMSLLFEKLFCKK